MRTAKTLVRLGGCPGWSGSSLGAHAILLVLSCGGSYCECEQRRIWRDFAWAVTVHLCHKCPFLMPRLKYIYHFALRFTFCGEPTVLHVQLLGYRKNPKISDTRKFIVIILKVEQDGVSFKVMHPKDAAGIANSVDPDQTAPLGVVWSGSVLFAQICLSENLGTIQHLSFLFLEVALIGPLRLFHSFKLSQLRKLCHDKSHNEGNTNFHTCAVDGADQVPYMKMQLLTELIENRISSVNRQ